MAAAIATSLAEQPDVPRRRLRRLSDMLAGSSMRSRASDLYFGAIRRLAATPRQTADSGAAEGLTAASSSAASSTASEAAVVYWTRAERRKDQGYPSCNNLAARSD